MGKGRAWVYGGGACLLLLLSVVVSLSLGSARVPLKEVWDILLHRLPFIGDLFPSGGWKPENEVIVALVRLPRVVLAMLVGASLAVAGAGFQGVLRNPLADPYTLGVASGSSVGAAFVILFGMQSLWGMWAVPFAAFVMGLLTLVIVYFLSGRSGRLRIETIILSGVIVQAFFGSFVSLMVSLSRNVVNEIVFWLMGSVAMRGWEYSRLVAPFLIVVTVVLVAFSRALNLFTLGEKQAEHMGVNVQVTKLVVLGASSLLTAAVVSVSGVIGFVGLIVPHLVRLFAGPDHKLLIPLSAIVGGIYVVWADTLARLVLSGQEIPLGVVTALVGAPFFVYLLKKRDREATR
ncbi:FecCD family ABC transporter permease [Gorillibacterium massiliense]|uniref:FecCD family ABC transporter permease n=1 Tax=Gorillibacterium massiliense TaxID=1280390 RepID=UPI0004AC86A4|nr:iron ABC transporter permease [Gorillibacterium massiliense]